MAKVFISYKRNLEPDTPVAVAVFNAIRQEHDVFIDTTIQVGEKWAERIQDEIKQSDFLIVFLSEHSVHSEMVIAEVETAHHHKKTYGKPTILPVRLNYAEPLVYPLSAYLNPLQWAIWAKRSDTLKVITELRKAIRGGHLLMAEVELSDRVNQVNPDIPTAFANIPRDLGSPEGTMPHESPFYIEREQDYEAMQALEQIKGVTITIKGPRQMGKSSLLNKLLVEAEKRKMRTAFIDFQLIETSAIENSEIFYRQFCSLLSWEFQVEDRSEEYWRSPLGNKQKTTTYVLGHLLKSIDSVPILVAMDEVERMFPSPFRSDFFSMLRNWHNNRARSGDWARFNMALVTSTEPYQFIVDLNQSPFNVGHVIELSDFTLRQVTELNHRHGNPLDEKQVKQLYGLLGGHPYLTRKALYLVANRRITFSVLLKNGCEDDGPFGDHLRNYLFRMAGQHDLKAGLIQVLKFQQCADEHVLFQLRGAGLIRRMGSFVKPRNTLYADYFRKRLRG